MTAAPLLVDIARERWAIDLPDAWRPRFETVFSHLRVPDGRDEGVEVGVRCAEQPDDAHADWARNVIARVDDPDGVASVDDGSRHARISRLSIDTFDDATVTGESFLLDQRMVDVHLGTNLLLAHVVWRARQLGLVPVHAAAVGRDGRFVLIPAAAGAGKSTLAASALAAGLDVLGDDFVLVDAESGTLHSLYAAIRLAPAAQKMVAAAFGDDAWTILGRRVDDKLLLAPAGAPGAGRFVADGRLVGVCVVERSPTAALGPIAPPPRVMSSFASTLRLAPTIGLPVPGAVRALGSVARSVPARVLRTGPDLVDVVRCVDEMIEGLS